jgi:hypothetical protein
MISSYKSEFLILKVEMLNHVSPRYNRINYLELYIKQENILKDKEWKIKHISTMATSALK